MALESTIETYFCKRVSELGGETWKTQAIGRRGFPDRVAVLPGGVVLFVELKRPKGGRRAVHQTKIIGDMRALGARAMFLKTKEEVDEALQHAITS